MIRPEQILAYTTASSERDPSIHRAVRLARATGARVTLADVLPPDDVARPLQWRKRIRRAQLNAVVAQLRELGVDADSRVAVGEPAPELVRMVVDSGYDALIKTATVSDFKRHLFFGTTARTLLRHCPCPVWVTREIDRGQVRRVLAAVEVAEPGSSAAQLTESVMSVALEVAKWESADLHLCNTFYPIGQSLLASHARGGSQALATEYLQALRDRRSAELMDLATEAGVRPTALHVKRGLPEKQVPALAEQIDADLVVIGTLGRTGLSGLFYGNTVEEVLRAIPRAVLAVKPPGFVSDLVTSVPAQAS